MCYPMLPGICTRPWVKISFCDKSIQDFTGGDFPPLPTFAGMEQEFDIAVIGGGCVGLSAAYKIQRRYPAMRIIVFEKEDRLAPHQTGNNSGVMHSGLYYKPGSYRARNCVSGRRELVAFAKEHGVAHDICGKVVAAVEKSELPFMKKVFANGQENKVEGIELISGEKVGEIEPYVKAIAGIWVPCTGIIDYPALCHKLAKLIQGIQPGSKILTGAKVNGFPRHDGLRYIKTTRGDYKAKQIIVCAGLQSDRMARMDGLKPVMRIVGFRGDYYELTASGEGKVRNLIYPVPNPKFPFLGVHFTRLVTGGTECGPNAVFTFKREGYGKMDFNLKDTLEAVGFSGTWRLFFRNTRFGIDEQLRAFSKKRFLKTLQRLIPSLAMSDIEPGRAGVRAMALAPDGNMIDDFLIETKEDAIHVLNAPSPAATACLAIGEEISSRAIEHFGLR